MDAEFVTLLDALFTLILLLWVLSTLRQIRDNTKRTADLAQWFAQRMSGK